MPFRAFLAACLLVIPIAHAGFVATITGPASVNVNGTPLERYDVFARNTGGISGTHISQMEFFFSGFNGTRAYFEFADQDGANNDDTGPDGIPDTVILNGNGVQGTQIRLNNVAARSTYSETDPTEFLQFSQPNPFASGLSFFRGRAGNAIITDTDASNAPGYRIARLFVTPNAQFVFSGAIRGDRLAFNASGPEFPFGVSAGNPTPRIVFDPIPDVNIVFEPNPFDNRTFVAPLRLATFPGNSVALRIGSVDGVFIATVGGVVNPNGIGEYVISGSVLRSAVGSTLIVPIWASDGMGNYAESSFRMNVFNSPEPSSLALLGVGSLLIRRRRS